MPKLTDAAKRRKKKDELMKDKSYWEKQRKRIKSAMKKASKADYALLELQLAAATRSVNGFQSLILQHKRTDAERRKLKKFLKGESSEDPRICCSADSWCAGLFTLCY